MTTTDTQTSFDEVCAAMGEPAFYAHGPQRVAVLETAISMVFVAESSAPDSAEVVENQRDDWVDLDEIDPSRHLIVRNDREPAEIADEIEAMLDHATAT